MTRLEEDEAQEEKPEALDATLARATHQNVPSFLWASRAAAVEGGEGDGDPHHLPLLHGQEKPKKLH